jgi:hypothetical protein
MCDSQNQGRSMQPLKQHMKNILSIIISPTLNYLAHRNKLKQIRDMVWTRQCQEQDLVYLVWSAKPKDHGATYKISQERTILGGY